MSFVFYAFPLCSLPHPPPCSSYLKFHAEAERRVLIGELDEATDKAVDLSTIRAEPLPPIRY